MIHQNSNPYHFQGKPFSGSHSRNMPCTTLRSKILRHCTWPDLVQQMTLMLHCIYKMLWYLDWWPGVHYLLRYLYWWSVSTIYCFAKCERPLRIPTTHAKMRLINRLTGSSTKSESCQKKKKKGFTPFSVSPWQTNAKLEQWMHLPELHLLWMSNMIEVNQR